MNRNNLAIKQRINPFWINGAIGRLTYLWHILLGLFVIVLTLATLPFIAMMEVSNYAEYSIYLLEFIIIVMATWFILVSIPKRLTDAKMSKWFALPVFIYEVLLLLSFPKWILYPLFIYSAILMVSLLFIANVELIKNKQQ